MKKGIALTIAVMLSMVLCAAGALAAYENPFRVIHSIDKNELAEEWDDDQGILKINESNRTISMKNSESTIRRIEIDGRGFTEKDPLVVTLDGVNITRYVVDDAPLKINGHVKIILQGTNTLSFMNGPGLHTDHNGFLTISCGRESEDHVCDEACGALTATGGRDGAGIGGNQNGNGHVTITGGNVTANANGIIRTGAGIGGGYSGSGYVTISGGNVYATGGDEAAGIGGGGGNACHGYVTITGGKVEVYGKGGGAGIGGGYNGEGHVTITGGDVIAKALNKGAGIGGGADRTYDVTISGGNIHATGSNWAAGIGGTYTASGIVRISGGYVEATGGENAAGIGGGYNSENKNIEGHVMITGGEVHAIGGASGAGIGGGYRGSGHVTISGGYVKVTGGEMAAGAGGGRYGSGDVTITGGEVCAAGGDSGAGVGGGDGASGIARVSGGNVEATGGIEAAGVGGGKNGSGDVTISGGKVTAKSVTDSADAVGAGMYGDRSSTVVKVAGAAGTMIAARAGMSEADAKALPGSPFRIETDVTGQAAYKLFFETIGMPIPPDTGGMPQTGDPGSLALWAAMLAASGAALKAGKRRR